MRHNRELGPIWKIRPIMGVVCLDLFGSRFGLGLWPNYGRVNGQLWVKRFEVIIRLLIGGLFIMIVRGFRELAVGGSV